MALQLRRGTTAQLTTITPAQGELLYVTDYAANNVSPLYVGDGSTPGGRPAGVTSVNGLNGAVALTTTSVPEGTGPTAGQYFTQNRGADAAGSMLAGGVLSNLTISYNSTTHTITISNPSVIQSGTINSLGYWAANGTALSPSQNLLWNETSNILQNLNGTFQVIANNNSRGIILADTYSSAVASNAITMRKARGTSVSPTAVLSGDMVGQFNFQGYDGATYGTTAYIGSVVQANPTSGSGQVQGNLVFYVTNTSGVLTNTARLSNAGTFLLGPGISTDGGTGAIVVTQTVSGGTSGAYNTSLRNYYSDTNGPHLDFRKYRGNFATQSTVVSGDSLGIISGKGYDGANPIIGATINILTDGTVSTGKVPGAIVFSTATANGVLTQAMKIDKTQNVTIYGNLTVTGTITDSGETITGNLSVSGKETIGGLNIKSFAIAMSAALA